MSTIVLITASNEFVILSALKPIPSATRHRPFRPRGGQYVSPCYAWRYFFAAIGNNLLFVEASVDYIIIKYACIVVRMYISTNLNILSVRDLFFMLSEALFNYTITGRMFFGNPPKKSFSTGH